MNTPTAIYCALHKKDLVHRTLTGHSFAFGGEDGGKRAIELLDSRTLTASTPRDNLPIHNDRH
jgi:hypothetical protein